MTQVYTAQQRDNLQTGGEVQDIDTEFYGLMTECNQLIEKQYDDYLATQERYGFTDHTAWYFT